MSSGSWDFHVMRYFSAVTSAQKPFSPPVFLNTKELNKPKSLISFIGKRASYIIYGENIQ